MKSYDFKYKASIIEQCKKNSVETIAKAEGISPRNIRRWLLNKETIFVSALNMVKSGITKSRVRSSTFQAVVDHIFTLLKANNQLSNGELRAAAMAFATENSVDNFKCTDYFLYKTRNLYFLNNTYLYKRLSLLRTQDGRRIAGNGCFSTINYKFNEVIQKFNGTVRTKAQYMRRLQQGKGGYAIRLRVDGTAYDCYDQWVRDKCPCSWSNDPSGSAKFLAGGRKAAANAHVSISGTKVLLVAGRVLLPHEDEDSMASWVLKAGTEILWEYGDLYHHDND